MLEGLYKKYVQFKRKKGEKNVKIVARVFFYLMVKL